MIKNAEEVEEFLSKNPDPKLVVTSTIHDGYVSCIGPVPTLFGPELHCNSSTHKDLIQFLTASK